jgi:hypothetical protein
MTQHTYFNLAATLECSRTNSLFKYINLWRGSLSDRRTVALDCAAVANPGNVVCLMLRVCWFWGRFATQREQAPSPQVGVRLGVCCGLGIREQARSHGFGGLPLIL